MQHPTHLTPDDPIPECRCPPLPYVENADPDQQAVECDSVVTFTCAPGHRFSDGTTQKWTRCSGGVWGIIGNCKGLPDHH